MIVIGLTGSIGMGKSATARMFRGLGVPVHEADAAVHKLLSPKGRAFEEVAVTFPEAWDKHTHTIRRDILADIIFSDVKKKRELEKILHPLVRADQKEFLRKERRAGKKFTALDIPLLFETGAEKRVDVTVCVTAPAHIQRQRVLKRPGMTAEKFRAILKAQMPDREKRARADYVVHTGQGYAYTLRSLRKILRELRHDTRDSP